MRSYSLLDEDIRQHLHQHWQVLSLIVGRQNDRVFVLGCHYEETVEYRGTKERDEERRP